MSSARERLALVLEERGADPEMATLLAERVTFREDAAGNVEGIQYWIGGRIPAGMDAIEWAADQVMSRRGEEDEEPAPRSRKEEIERDVHRKYGSDPSWSGARERLGLGP